MEELHGRETADGPKTINQIARNTKQMAAIEQILELTPCCSTLNSSYLNLNNDRHLQILIIAVVRIERDNSETRLQHSCVISTPDI